jgi:hypothetical protein
LSENVGTESMTALQQSLRDRSAEFAANPFLSNGGRIMNIHDPDRYGWSNVRSAAERDGLVGLTMVDQDTTLLHLESMFGTDADLPFWQVFVGEPDDVLPACESVLRDITLPTGWRVESQTNPDDDTIEASRVLNTQTGVAPAPVYYLRGDHLPSMLTCIFDAAGRLAACACASIRYHPEGPLSGWIFAGGVSVSPDHRRKALGSYVNAALLADSQKAFNWKCALEQAKFDNTASVGMIKRCGLRAVDGKVTVIINLTGSFVTR